MSHKIRDAVSAIKNSSLSIRSAAKTFGVSYTTLQRKLKNDGHKISAQEHCILTKEEEQYIVSYIIQRGQQAFPMTIQDLQLLAGRIIEKNPRKLNCVLKNGIPGRMFINGFLKRNPQISLRKCEGIPKSSAKVSLESVQSWFNWFYNYINENSLTDIILNHPENILNCDESSMPLVAIPKKVLGQKGERNRYHILPGNHKEAITTLFTANAVGALLNPFICFKGSRVSSELAKNLPEDIDFALTEEGWMEAGSFLGKHVF